MARPPKNQDANTVASKLSSLDKYLKDNSEHHFAFDNPVEYIVSSGSLVLDMEMGGGIRPGVVRSTGITEGGKTSNALAFARNFQKVHPDNGVVVYIKAEGRLSKEIISRSGVDTDPKRWKVIPTNDFEFVIDMIRDVTKLNPDDHYYMFVIDSLDSLVPRNDMEKGASEADRTAGGALLTSNFLRKMANYFSTKGHICFLISQVRSTIKINPYEKGDPKVTNASGGNAALHYSDWILEFQQRFQKDIIFGGPDNKTPIGHWCKIMFRKTPNEKTGVEVKYPIKYGRDNGNSIWIEYEVIEQLKAWEMIEAKTAWITVCDDLLKELAENGFTVPKQIQGMDNFRKLLEEDQKLTAYLFEKFIRVFKK
jgi:RecA/RadA recombinase